MLAAQTERKGFLFAQCRAVPNNGTLNPNGGAGFAVRLANDLVEALVELSGGFSTPTTKAAIP